MLPIPIHSLRSEQSLRDRISADCRDNSEAEAIENGVKTQPYLPMILLKWEKEQLKIIMEF